MTFVVDGITRLIHVFYNDIYGYTMPIHADTKRLAGFAHLWPNESIVLVNNKQHSGIPSIPNKLRMQSWHPERISRSNFINPK